jgi:hypothetical protein
MGVGREEGEVAVEGDEMDGLVGSAGGSEDGQGEGLPAYDEAVGVGSKKSDGRSRAEGDLV